MATVKDFPKVVKKVGFTKFAKLVWAEVNEDDVFTWGSALAYAWIFAVFPFVIFLLTLAPYLPFNVKQRAMDEISNAAYSGLGGQGGYQIVQSVQEVMSKQQGGLLSFGIILALWGASGGMNMTMNALNKAYYVSCNRPFIKQRLIAIGLTLASAVLILCVLVLLPVGTQLVDHLFKMGSLGMVGVWIANILRYGLALAMMFATISMIYYYGPCIKQKWHAVTPGAIFTVIVWIVLGFGFAYYVANFGNFNATYGALGGAIVLLLFFYINAVVLLVGAEVNSVIDFQMLPVEKGERDLAKAEDKVNAEADNAASTPQKQPARLPEPAAPSRSVQHRPAKRKRSKALVWVPALLGVRWAFKRWRASLAAKRDEQLKVKRRWAWG